MPPLHLRTVQHNLGLPRATTSAAASASPEPAAAEPTTSAFASAATKPTAAAPSPPSEPPSPTEPTAAPSSLSEPSPPT